jgi:short-subunit dehydrogenase
MGSVESGSGAARIVEPPNVSVVESSEPDVAITGGERKAPTTSVVRPTALIVGATGGIGRAVSAVVAAEKYRVSLVGRREDNLKELSRQLELDADDAQVLVADLLDPVAPGDLVAAHVARFGRLDLLINTSGIGQRRMLAEVDVGRSRRLLDVNLTATISLLAATLPELRKAVQTRPGALIVLLSSLVADRPLSGYGLYSATKAAVSSLARSVNEEENLNGIRATAICPGFVDTDLTGGLEKRPGEFLAASDIAEVVRFLIRLSPSARVPSLEVLRTDAEAGRP